MKSSDCSGEGLVRSLRSPAAAAWDRNAEFWDLRMGEGNRTHLQVVLPSTARLLRPRPGERLLDLACGNGQMSRWLADRGARVVGVDISEGMLARARARSREYGDRIRFVRADLTTSRGGAALGAHRYDAAVCTMAIMDMQAIEPMFRAVRRRIVPHGRFVFSLLHPSFSHTGARIVRGRDRRGRRSLGVEVTEYLSTRRVYGEAMVGQPVLHPYYERPLSAVLAAAFRAGWVLDALEEPTFRGTWKRLPWNSPVRLREIPFVVVGRLRPRPPGGTPSRRRAPHRR